MRLESAWPSAHNGVKWWAWSRGKAHRGRLSRSRRVNALDAEFALRREANGLANVHSRRRCTGRNCLSSPAGDLHSKPPRLAALRDKDEAWWEEETTFFDVRRSRAWVMTRRLTHTAHHRGQQLALLRMLGREEHEGGDGGGGASNHYSQFRSTRPGWITGGQRISRGPCW
jgi:hypothetical protein